MTERDYWVPLEERLYTDTSGELRRSLVEQLGVLRDGLLAQRRQLHSRERYLDLQAALNAVEAALATLRALRIAGTPP